MDLVMDNILILVAFFFGGGGVITGIVMYIEIKKHRPVKAASDANLYIEAGETQMTTAEDTFLRTHTTRVKVASSSSSGSGKR
jgi:hypothetical protein